MFWILEVSTVRYKGSCSAASLSITGSFKTLGGEGRREGEKCCWTISKIILKFL